MSSWQGSRACSTPRIVSSLGTDLVKETARLEAAYDDAAGVTAEFNKNVLRVLNRELDADFEVEAFAHRAFYDTENARIDIRLRSLAEQSVSLPGIGMTIELQRGEEIRTEISCKFTRSGLERIFATAGLEMTGWFTDPDGDFALSLARAAANTCHAGAVLAPADACQAAKPPQVIPACRRGVSAGRCMSGGEAAARSFPHAGAVLAPA